LCTTVYLESSEIFTPSPIAQAAVDALGNGLGDAHGATPAPGGPSGILENQHVRLSLEDTPYRVLAQLPNLGKLERGEVPFKETRALLF
jgi:hypothetical protein